MKALSLLLLFLSLPVLAVTTTIKDPNNDYYLQVNSDGSINTTGGGGGGTVNQGAGGVSPWLVTAANLDVALSTRASESTLSLFKTANHTDLSLINTTLGSPFQAGGSIGNTAFGISGTLPAFASTPTFNVGTTGGLALDTTLSSFKSANHTDLTLINTTLGSPFQVGGLIGNTAFIANAGTNLNTSALNLETTQSGFKSANHTDLTTINATLGSPFQAGGSIGNTSFGVTQGTNPWLERPTDGTNPMSKTFDLDTSGSTHEYNLGVTLRLGGNGGSVAGGTSGNPIRTDPTGTTPQPASQSGSWAVTANAGTNLNTSALNLEATQSSFKSANHTDLALINTTLGSPFQAGGSIGNTAFIANAGTNLNTSALALESGGHLASIDTKLTAPLTTNATLQAGSALVGKVGIDQTTPGTTNGVVVNSSALPTGAATSANQTSQITQETTTATNTGTIAINQTSGGQKTQRVDGSGNVAPAMDTAARAGFQKITDGTNIMAVKAASTAAAASDPSSVVALSPNSPVPAGTNLIGKAGIDQTTPGTTNLVAATPVDGYKATYSACSGSFTLAALATDVFTLQGSGTKTIRVIHIDLDGSTTSGSGALAVVSVLRRSAANTGGTSTTITAAQHDSSSAAPTATAVFYTVNPSAVGASAGILRSERLNLTAIGTPGQGFIDDFGVTPGQAVVLRGTSQFIAVNFNTTTVTGGTVDICVDWTEE